MAGRHPYNRNAGSTDPARRAGAVLVPLSSLSPGEAGLVRSVRGALTGRLVDLGLVPGTPVRLKGVAPLGDPLLLEVRGSLLGLRRCEADWILVVRES